MDKRIVYQTVDGGVAVVIPAPDCGLTVEEIATKDVPAGTPFKIVNAAGLPQDRSFRGAWTLQGSRVEHDLAKAKVIAHNFRRAARDAEFAPHDDIIAKQIPGKTAAAETARQAIRDKYDRVQQEIDNAASVDTLKTVLGL